MRILLQVALSLGLLIGGLLFYLLFWPISIDPLAYRPPAGLPLEGPLQPNHELRRAEIIAVGSSEQLDDFGQTGSSERGDSLGQIGISDWVDGPEDTELDSSGRLYAGTRRGEIIRIDSRGNIESFAKTGGRPLGMKFDPQGNLIVCVLLRGLLSIDPAGQVELLVSELNGQPLHFSNDLDISSDGIIYFSLSTKYRDGRYDLLEGRPHGQLLRYDRKKRRQQQLLGDLYFPNGVALSQQEDFILVGETFQYRIRRYWLKGERAGQSDIFIEGLPGFPDNINRNPAGNFWVALYSLRDKGIDNLHSQPLLKKIAARIPAVFWPAPQPYGLIVELGAKGGIVRSLHDPGGQHIGEISSAKERGGHLFLSTAGQQWIARLPIR